MTLPMHAYQVRAVDWMRQRDSGYLAVDMGLGKTRMVLEYIRYTKPSAVLVVAPLRVALTTWPEEIQKWTPEIPFAILHGNHKEDAFKSKAVIYIINYDGLKWFDQMVRVYGRGKFMKGLLILDESTMVKSPKSLRFKVLKNLRAVFSKAFCLSATPSPNGYQDLWSQYFLLDYGATLGPSYSQFFNKYFYQLESRRIVPVALQRLKEIPAICSKSTFRLDANDYLKLPEYVVNDYEVYLPGDLRKKYNTLAQEFLLRLDKEQQVTAVNSAVLSMKLRQFCQGAFYLEEEEEKKTIIPVHELKLDMLEDIVASLNGSPTLVAIQFKYEVDMIRRRFPGTPAIYGGTAAEESKEILADWNKGKLPILVCHPASLSHGVNLQSGGHYITWLALTWNFEQYTQFNGRLRRQGQKNTVFLNHVVIKDSVESRIAEALKRKDMNQSTLLNVLREMTKNA